MLIFHAQARASLLEDIDDAASETASSAAGSRRSHNPPVEIRRKQPAGQVRSVEPSKLTPRDSVSSRHPRYSDHRQQAFGQSEGGSVADHGSVRLSSEIPTSTAPPSTYNSDVSRRRGNSLGGRFPGDVSHQPLDVIRRDSRKAHRAPHLRRHQHQGADIIDKLAGLDDAYHHEGPYDAASLARNRHYKNSPLEAVESTNREALKAVPREKVVDSITRHRPLDGFAFVPPGFPDRDGRVLRYQEGTDMQRFNGADYGRWPGIVSRARPSATLLADVVCRTITLTTSKARVSLRIPSRRRSRTTKETYTAASSPKGESR